MHVLPYPPRTVPSDPTEPPTGRDGAPDGFAGVLAAARGARPVNAPGVPGPDRAPAATGTQGPGDGEAAGPAGAHTPAVADATEVADTDGARPGSDVAAMVHATIAGWRADPGGVALGVHLHRALRARVGEVAAPEAARVGTGEVARPAPGIPTPEAVAVPAATAETGGGAELGTAALVVSAAALADPSALPAEPDPVAPEHAAPGRSSAGEGVQTAARPATSTAGGAAPVRAEAPDAPAEVVADEGPGAPPAPPAAPTSGPRVVTSDSSAAPTGELAAPTGAVTRTVPAPPPSSHPVPRRPSVEAVADQDPTPADAAARPGLVPTVPAPSPAVPTPAAAAVERVLAAVEALEHAPPPRTMHLEVDGVRLSVALSGDEVHVAVRGDDRLAAGWQRDLATALRGRGLGLAGGTAGGHAGHGGRGGPGDRSTPPRTTTTPTARPSRTPAEPAGTRL